MVAARQGKSRDHPRRLPQSQANPETFNLELYLKYTVFASQGGQLLLGQQAPARVLCCVGRAQSREDLSGPQLQGRKLVSDSAPFRKPFSCRMWFPFNQLLMPACSPRRFPTLPSAPHMIRIWKRSAGPSIWGPRGCGFRRPPGCQPPWRDPSW